MGPTRHIRIWACLCLCSDNAFLLMPGKKMLFTFTGDTPLDPNTFWSKLQVKSIRDTYMWSAMSDPPLDHATGACTWELWNQPHTCTYAYIYLHIHTYSKWCFGTKFDILSFTVMIQVTIMPWQWIDIRYCKFQYLHVILAPATCHHLLTFIGALMGFSGDLCHCFQTSCFTWDCFKWGLLAFARGSSLASNSA